MKYNYIWKLSDYPKDKDKHNSKVFSCFSGSGGSTMGYKLAGYNVIGANEIDKKMGAIYQINHKPKYFFKEPIQELKNMSLPKELYSLDILDGSPPCSAFSIQGSREKVWGKEKKFREGQINQVLDTLFFDFITLAKKLQPKIVVAENVIGLLIGNAKKYVTKIYKEFNNANYVVNHWLLDSISMGVPQSRKRVFFIAVRKDILEKNSFINKKNSFIIPNLNLDLTFNEKRIPYLEVENKAKEIFNSCNCNNVTPLILTALKNRNNTSGKLFKNKAYCMRKLNKNQVIPTITTGSGREFYHYSDIRCISKEELILCSSFPIDFNFINNNINNTCYCLGMSVPPVMMAQIADRIYNQWLSKIGK